MTYRKKHKVFVSFHHEDQGYKDRFVEMMGDDIVNKSVEDGDVDDLYVHADTIRRNIREGHIADATITVVLVGTCTWQRKHVDWEISYSLRETTNKYRCGLLGILLPTHPHYETGGYDPYLIPPRLADNCNGGDAYASIHDWSTKPSEIRRWIHKAFTRRNEMSPDNGRMQFQRNKNRDCSDGWLD